MSLSVNTEPFIAVPQLSTSATIDPLEATGRMLRWGVVATGRIAGAVTADIARLADAELYAVSSRSPQRASEFAAKYGFKKHYADDDGGSTGRSPAAEEQTTGSAENGAGTGRSPGAAGPLFGYEQLLADPEVDVVYVATPHGQHFEVASAALKAGKHVLCEKSLTINAREAAELIELARANGLFLMEAVWTRFLPSVQRAWDIVRSGELGRITWVQADLGFPAPFDPEARIWALNDGGGALLDLTVYPLTWALGTLGRPDSCVATGSLNEHGVDQQNALQLGYASGAQAQLTSSLLASSPRTATICGTEGWLRTNEPLHNPTELTISTEASGLRTERFEQTGNGYVYELREVSRCIQDGVMESPTMPWADSLETMRLFDSVREQLGVRYPNDA